MADQLRFAAQSGDRNLLHLDAMAARRTEAGAPVVHGMHAVLWALDELSGAGIAGENLAALRVQFRKFMFVDRPIDLKLTRRDGDDMTAELSSDGLLVALLLLRNGPRKIVHGEVGSDWPAIAASGKIPNAPTLEQAATLSGWLPPPDGAAELAREFAQLARSPGARAVEELASLSRLVGMICPGLHSLFAGFAVDFVEAAQARAGLGFKVTLAHARTRLINIDVVGRGIVGKVTAFMPAPPVASPSMPSLSGLIGAQDFAGTVALIIGGSRGLGAVTAKAIAAGGGSVIVTYARGRADALQLADEINAARGASVCAAHAYDSAGSAAGQLGALPDAVNQLYYFATPPIFQQKPEAFSDALLQEFRVVYVDGFADVCRYVRARSKAATLAVFYPSSVAVDERPANLAEYGKAKEAGEQLCAGLVQELAGLRILVRRLPRVLTDQTNTVAQVKSADAVDVMLPVIRELCRLS